MLPHAIRMQIKVTTLGEKPSFCIRWNPFSASSPWPWWAYPAIRAFQEIASRTWRLLCICWAFTSFPHFEQRPDPFLWHFFLFSMCSMVASSCIILLTTPPDCNVCRFCMRPIFVYNMFNSLVYISSIRAISCCMWNWISLAIYCLPPSTLHTTPFALFSRHEVR